MNTKENVGRIMRAYGTVPWLTGAETLLMAASKLWYPWGNSRRSELERIARDIASMAEEIRTRAFHTLIRHFSKLARIDSPSLNMKFGSRNHALLLSKTIEPSPETTKLLSGLVFQLLLEVYKHVSFLEADASNDDLKVSTNELSKLIEPLSESPCRGQAEVSTECLKKLGRLCTTLECETMFYNLASADDDYTRRHGRFKKKKARITAEQMRNLAAEIGVSYEILRDVLETEYSASWESVKQFREQAEAEKQSFLTLLSDDIDKIRFLRSTSLDVKSLTMIETVWDLGTAYSENQAYMILWRPEQFQVFKNTIWLFVSYLCPDAVMQDSGVPKLER